jgi:hypothetical protein
VIGFAMVYASLLNITVEPGLAFAAAIALRSEQVGAVGTADGQAPVVSVDTSTTIVIGPAAATLDTGCDA